MRPDLDAIRSDIHELLGDTRGDIADLILDEFDVLLDYVAELETRLGVLSLPPKESRK